MKIAVVGDTTTDISPLLTSCSWSGDRTQAARKLEFSFVQDDRDAEIPVIDIDCGYTVVGGDDDGNIVFRGNVYAVRRDRSQSTVEVLAYDNLWILNRSKTSRKFKDALPEDIAREICDAMGVKTSNIAKTGTTVSFIANAKTGFNIIMSAYTEAKKKTGGVYMCMMDGDSLSIVEKGERCGVTLNASANMMESVYRESIESLVNAVQIVDENGSIQSVISKAESIERYSMFMEVYKIQKDKDAQTEAADMLNNPEREGYVTAPGDYRAKAGYSLVVKDALFSGSFYIKSDVHTWRDGIHEMRLQLEFENLMLEVEAEHEKSS